MCRLFPRPAATMAISKFSKPHKIVQAVLIPKKDLLARVNNHDPRQYNSIIDNEYIRFESDGYAMLRSTARAAPPAITRGERICIQALRRRILENLPSLLENQYFLFRDSRRISPWALLTFWRLCPLEVSGI